MARKRTLIKQLESITAQIEMLSTQLFTKDQEARMWREKYELSQLTPEVKADTEAAFELQLIKMEKKINAGARFFQTQAVYDADAFAKFMKRVEGFKIPVLAGIIPLKSVGMARFMNKNVAGVFVPEEQIKKMADAKDKTQTGLQIAADLKMLLLNH